MNALCLDKRQLSTAPQEQSDGQLLRRNQSLHSCVKQNAYFHRPIPLILFMQFFYPKITWKTTALALNIKTLVILSIQKLNGSLCGYWYGEVLTLFTTSIYLFIVTVKTSIFSIITLPTTNQLIFCLFPSVDSSHCHLLTYLYTDSIVTTWPICSPIP